MQTILQLDSSSQTQSKTRQATLSWSKHIKQEGDQVIRKDLTQLPLIDGPWIQANFTPDDQRTEQQIDTLSLSDDLITEVEQADVLVIGAPVYNFGIPVALKAWIDLVARARKTFRYTENGPEGLLSNKKVYVIYASGGTPMGSAQEFVTPYLKQALGFLGLTDITFIDSKEMETA